MSFRLLLITAILAIGNNRCARVDAQSIESIDSRQIFGNASLVISFQIERLEEYLDEETKNELKGIHEWITETIYLDTSKCSEFIIQFGADEYGVDHRAPERSVGFVFRGAEDIPQEQIDDFIEFAGLDEQTWEDTEYYRAQRDPLFYFSENSLLIACEDRVKKLIDTETGSMSEREVPLLEFVTSEADICARIDFTNESFSSFFAILFNDGYLWEENTGDVVSRLADNSLAATMTVQLDDKTPLVIEIDARDGQLDEVRSAAEDFVVCVEECVAKIARQMREAPGGIGETSLNFFHSLESMINATTVTADGSTVTITIEPGDDATVLINEFVQMMAALVNFFG